MVERLAEYRHKLRVLRQIMSNKAQHYARINNAANIARVVVASFLTFMGFAGISRVYGWISMFAAIEQSTVELGFTLTVFSLFVLVILHLVFRFNTKQFEGERAVVMLTQLANEVDDILAAAERGYSVTRTEVDLIRSKYDTITQVIPANSDEEFLRAKEDYRDKEQRKTEIALGAGEMFDPSAQRRSVKALVARSPLLMRILDALRGVDGELFLGGGLIRNAVWDYLHGYSSPTPIDDVDVIYFDPAERTKEHDAAFEQKLRAAVPNLRWSVKNQARMHEMNHDTPYSSLEDAVSKWPETATAIVARLGDDGEIEIIAPHGFDDLFRLVVSPTPHFGAKLAAYQGRVWRKNWGQHWPRLRFLGTEPAPSTRTGLPPTAAGETDAVDAK